MSEVYLDSLVGNQIMVGDFHHMKPETVITITDSLLDRIAIHNGAGREKVVQWLKDGKTVWTNFHYYKLVKE